MTAILMALSMVLGAGGMYTGIQFYEHDKQQDAAAKSFPFLPLRMF